MLNGPRLRPGAAEPVLCFVYSTRIICSETAPKSGKYTMPLANNRNLEQLFDLPESDKNHESVTDPVSNGDTTAAVTLPSSLDALAKIEEALPAVRGLEASDTEMDELAGRATESFNDLMDLGMQVDSRYASEIFAVASTMLGHAITAKTAKINKKLRMIDLQLKKARLDQTQDSENKTPTGEGRILDRNELLKTLLSNTNENSSTGK